MRQVAFVVPSFTQASKRQMHNGSPFYLFFCSICQASSSNSCPELISPSGRRASGTAMSDRWDRSEPNTNYHVWTPSYAENSWFSKKDWSEEVLEVARVTTTKGLPLSQQSPVPWSAKQCGSPQCRPSSLPHPGQHHKLGLGLFMLIERNLERREATTKNSQH